MNSFGLFGEQPRQRQCNTKGGSKLTASRLNLVVANDNRFSPDRWDESALLLFGFS